MDNFAMMPTERLGRPGGGLDNGRRVLSYADLRTTRLGTDLRPPLTYSKPYAFRRESDGDRFLEVIQGNRPDDGDGLCHCSDAAFSAWSRGPAMPMNWRFNVTLALDAMTDL